MVCAYKKKYNMPTYTLVPKFNKSIVEYDIWTNPSNETITTCNYWRFGEILVTCDEQPVIEVDCDDGVNIHEYFKDEYSRGNLKYNLNDCYRSEICDYPDNIRRKRKERIDDLWGDSDLEEDGWDITDTELWVYTDFHIHISS